MSWSLLPDESEEEVLARRRFHQARNGKAVSAARQEASGRAALQWALADTTPRSLFVGREEQTVAGNCLMRCHTGRSDYAYDTQDRGEEDVFY